MTFQPSFLGVTSDQQEGKELFVTRCSWL